MKKVVLIIFAALICTSIGIGVYFFDIKKDAGPTMGEFLGSATETVVGDAAENFIVGFLGNAALGGTVSDYAGDAMGGFIEDQVDGANGGFAAYNLMYNMFGEDFIDWISAYLMDVYMEAYYDDSVMYYDIEEYEDEIKKALEDFDGDIEDIEEFINENYGNVDGVDTYIEDYINEHSDEVSSLVEEDDNVPTSTPEPTPEPTEEPTPVPTPTLTKQELFFGEVTSSSALGQIREHTYYGSNTIDGNIKTAWVEGVSGLGEGEWIGFGASEAQWLTEIVLYSGYGNNFDENAYPNQIKLTLSDGSELIYDLDGEWQTITLPEPILTSYVKITILSALTVVHNGTDFYEDTAISEVEFYGLA